MTKERTVSAPLIYKSSYRQLFQGKILELSTSEEYGGSNSPKSLSAFTTEIMTSGSLSLSAYLVI